ncbi:hypothetical protein RS030_178 [Cryptosporidium xiaoi]|uniref:Ubiquitin-like domain-containing protein n=1 Tax=Cryptosporidium xiaoi TaxID=659607 RepID=A0AAV9XY61_9CRYT
MSINEIIDDDELLFGEDVSLSKETIEKRLSKLSKKRTNGSKKVKIGKKLKQSSDNAKCRNNNENNEQPSDKDAKHTDKCETNGKSLIITVEDNEEDEKDEQIKKNSKESIIKLNVKVYKRRESEIRIVKVLNIAIFRKDPVNKIVLYVSKNITAPGLDENEINDNIKVYFDGDLIEKYKLIEEIGVEDDEQLEVKIPFESNWI